MLYLIIILAIGWYVTYIVKQKYSFFKGYVGENFVSDMLINIDPTRYKVLNNLMLPSFGKTTTTQIDHVVISNFGIFCIETKSYSGWIFGKAQQTYWTQVIYRYKKRFYNPLRQNFAHIRAIEAVLESTFPQIKVLGFIAFPSADKLEITGTDAVGDTADVVGKIKAYTLPILSDTDRDNIVALLKRADITDKSLRKQHNTQVRRLRAN